MLLPLLILPLLLLLLLLLLFLRVLLLPVTQLLLLLPLLLLLHLPLLLLRQLPLLLLLLPPLLLLLLLSRARRRQRTKLFLQRWQRCQHDRQTWRKSTTASGKRQWSGSTLAAGAVVTAVQSSCTLSAKTHSIA